MKLRLIAAVALLVIAVSAAVGATLYLEHSTQRMTEALETALEAALTKSPDWKAATDEVTRLWERSSSFLHVLLPHMNLNELEWTLGTLPEYLEQRDHALYIEQCVRGLQCVKTVREMERPTLGNIF
ncbi:MAG: DUF4363 family protein [Oscillospiraceae bacterium]|nr:DUF4363 family protein [Oscillospiraceae bacterium]